MSHSRSDVSLITSEVSLVGLSTKNCTTVVSDCTHLYTTYICIRKHICTYVCLYMNGYLLTYVRMYLRMCIRICTYVLVWELVIFSKLITNTRSDGAFDQKPQIPGQNVCHIRAISPPGLGQLVEVFPLLYVSKNCNEVVWYEMFTLYIIRTYIRTCTYEYMHIHMYVYTRCYKLSCLCSTGVLLSLHHCVASGGGPQQALGAEGTPSAVHEK